MASRTSRSRRGRWVDDRRKITAAAVSDTGGGIAFYGKGALGELNVGAGHYAVNARDEDIMRVMCRQGPSRGTLL